MNVAAVQETTFTCAEDCQVLEDDLVVFSAFGSCCSAGVILLVGRGQLAVADVAVKSFELRVVAVYAPNIAGERHSFLRR